MQSVHRRKKQKRMHANRTRRNPKIPENRSKAESATMSSKYSVIVMLLHALALETLAGAIRVRACIVRFSY